MPKPRYQASSRASEKHRRRSQQERDLKRKFLLACGGSRTEPDCFLRLRVKSGNRFDLKIAKKPRGSGPKNVLERMKQEIELGARYDEAWIVIDTDQRTDSQLKPAFDWEDPLENHHLAASNPMFEYWLILHYEDGRHPDAKRHGGCKKHFQKSSGCAKGYPLPQAIFDRAERAVMKSESRLKELGTDYRGKDGWTTVHLLVKRMLKS